MNEGVKDEGQSKKDIVEMLLEMSRYNKGDQRCKSPVIADVSP